MDESLSDETTQRDPQVEAGSDLRDALGWVVLGVAVLIGSITMDRLEKQGINKYTIPGLVPGLLGLTLILLGVLLGLRGWRRGGFNASMPPLDRQFAKRLAMVIGLVVVFAVGLVGHGLPFWLASTIYVSVSIVALQAPQRLHEGRRVSLRDVAFALAVGLGSGAIVTYVFQDLFLVRLP